MNKILIIDDDRELCALIKRSVQSEHIEADFCNTGKEGLQKLKEQEYQLVVLDVMMPGMDGFETLEEIRKENSLPILMFTSKNDSASKVRGLRAGADDYLTKPFATKELLARVRAITRRVTDASSSQLTLGNVTLDCASFELMCGGQTLRLNRKEFQLLQLFMSYPNQTFSAEHLMQKIWGYESDAEINVVWVNISNLRKKFAALGADIYIRSHRNQGYQIEVKR